MALLYRPAWLAIFFGAWGVGLSFSPILLTGPTTFQVFSTFSTAPCLQIRVEAPITSYQKRENASSGNCWAKTTLNSSTIRHSLQKFRDTTNMLKKGYEGVKIGQLEIAASRIAYGKKLGMYDIVWRDWYGGLRGYLYHKGTPVMEQGIQVFVTLVP